MRRLMPIAAIALVLAACTPPPPPTPPVEPDLAPTWSTDVPTLGNVVEVDDVVLAYVAPAAGELELHAWSLETGDPLWHAEATTAGMAGGIAIQPAVLAHDHTGFVAFVAPTDGGTHEVVLANAQTGEHTPLDSPFDGVGEELWVEQRPHPCAGDDSRVPVRVCLAAAPSTNGFVTKLLQLDPTGIVMLQDAGATDRGREIGPDLYATEDRGPGAEHIEYVVGGVTQWSVAYHDVFGDGYSSDNGWHWQRDDDRGLMLGIANAGRGDDPDTFDLSTTTTVALSLDDGSVVWRAEHVALWCAVGADTLDVGCRYDDTVIEYHSDEPGDVSIAAGTIDIVRLDLDTGQPLWEVPVGDWLGADLPIQGLAHDEQHAVILQEGDAAMLDLDDGSLEPITWPTLPCTTIAYFEYPSFSEEGGELIDHRGGEIVFACDLDREPVPMPDVPAAWVQLAGTFVGVEGMLTEDAWWIVPTLDGLAAFEVPA